MRNIATSIKCKTICKIAKKTYRVFQCSYTHFHCFVTGRRGQNATPVNAGTKHNHKCDTTGFVHVTYFSKLSVQLFTRIDPFAVNDINLQWSQRS